MKRFLATLVAGIVLGSTGLAVAAQQGYFRSAGLYCQKTPTMVACVPLKGYGYGVAISKDVVLVKRYDEGGSNVTVFTRAQP